MASYVEKHLTYSLVGKRCYVRIPYQAKIDTGVILSVHNDGRSTHVRYMLDGETQTNITCPQLVFLSPPVQVKIRDIYGECTAWEESEIAYR